MGDMCLGRRQRADLLGLSTFDSLAAESQYVVRNRCESAGSSYVID